MIFEKVAAILAEQLDAEEDAITLDTSLVDDLGADSLDVVDLVMTLEDEFDMEIPDEDITEVPQWGMSSSTWRSTPDFSAATAPAGTGRSFGLPKNFSQRQKFAVKREEV